MFSKSCEYGIRATIFIAGESSKGKKTGIKEIAHKIGSPEAFTAKILQTLVKRKILASHKGPSGGFYMPKESFSRIKLAEIVFAIDGEAIFKDCVLGLAECSAKSPCPVHHKYTHLRSELEEMLYATSIDDLISGVHSGLKILKTI
jgi:Rrf2 family protein